ncbi:MAG TPA: hypothetical protein VLM80_00480 [Anaerolineales bacterium]|nr:hypothetical protein [Anaerolineales bacterium]
MKHQNCFWIVSLMALNILILGACQFQEPVDTTPPARDILFEDDFEDPNSGWNRVKAATGESDYADGMYRILVNDTHLDIWARPGLTYTDAIIEVEAIKVGGDRNNRIGIVCRVVGPTNFYALMISSDGFYGIAKVNGDRFNLIGTNSFQPSSAIVQGSALNHLRADCIGDTLTLYVNEEKVAEAKDSEYTYGDVGLLAGTYEITGTDIRFDNFIVTKP